MTRDTPGPDTMSAPYFDEILGRGRVMGIFRGQGPERTVESCHRAWDLGIDLVEITVETPDAFAALRAALDAARERGRTVGAGTVVEPEQVARVHELGAAFTVAPGLHPDATAEARRLGLPHLPGVATATEVAHARRLGYRWLKAFPAAQLTPGWVSAQLGPFPDTCFVATGGVDGRNATAFLGAGCRAVAVGSALTDPEQMETVAALARGEPG